MADDAEKSGRKQRGNPFKPGQSGNPAGRPAGVRNRVLAALDADADNAAPQLLKALVQAALAGDVQAARLVLDRAWPARKSRTVALDLPAVTTAEGIAGAMAAVVQAMAAGEIAPDEAAAVASVIEGQRRAIETTELAERIAALEADRRNQP
ncbi:DUF5681 domain-containing protein [Acidiphilium acidophilum]|uniref:DUF5681 domain-containing protein n=1 Tax=Acidiphilium acidophilum TaxID=76588 RepID=UPI002E8E6147|nr:DUF5681 domain-containing protein [Acidiphilium acidophilum]